MLQVGAVASAVRLLVWWLLPTRRLLLSTRTGGSPFTIPRVLQVTALATLHDQLEGLQGSCLNELLLPTRTAPPASPRALQMAALVMP